MEEDGAQQATYSLPHLPKHASEQCEYEATYRLKPVSTHLVIPVENAVTQKILPNQCAELAAGAPIETNADTNIRSFWFFPLQNLSNPVDSMNFWCSASIVMIYSKWDVSRMFEHSTRSLDHR